MLGFDTSTDCSKYASRLGGLGYQFACRYLCAEGDWRYFGEEERDALGRAGLAIVSLSEMGAGDKFSPDRGKRQADLACVQAAKLGQPEGTAIYFCIDTDRVTASQVIAHFEAIPEDYPYAIGAYGPGTLLAALLEAGLVEHTMLANATGWAGYKAFKNRADIVQALPITPFDAFAIDPCESARDSGFGEWRP